jgi:flagellar basal-body rod modification protein FlgD
MSSSFNAVSPGIIGQAEQQFQQPRTSGNSALGKDAFLTLLVTQMKTQDPLNPMDDKQFVAQLAQFSSLEQLTNINSGIDKLTTATTQQQMFSAASFIGKEVKAKGSSVSKTGDSVGAIYYTLPEAATKVSINIMDANNNILKTADLGAKAAGEQTYQWDGKNFSGQKVADGLYKVGVTTQTADGKSMLVDLSVTGVVNGVTNESGVFMLSTLDGRKVRFTDVQGIVTPKTSS